jgi:hypothetical protein
MASVHRDPRSPHGVWYCRLATADGRQVWRSTKNRDKHQAQILCDAWQETENEAANGINPRNSLPYRDQAIPRRPQRIYFAASRLEVKIGLTTDPPRRVAAMRVVRPDIRLLGDIPGDRETEKALHARFSKDRIGGEWFHFTEEIKCAIDELLAGNNGAVPLRIETSQAKLLAGPECLQVRAAADYSSLSSTELFRLCTQGEIESIHKLKPGQAKGIRLIRKSSLDEYLQSFLPGGSRYVPEEEIRNRREKLAERFSTKKQRGHARKEAP